MHEEKFCNQQAACITAGRRMAVYALDRLRNIRLLGIGAAQRYGCILTPIRCRRPGGAQIPATHASRSAQADSRVRSRNIWHATCCYGPLLCDMLVFRRTME